MSWVHGKSLKASSRYLLCILQAEGAVRFSRFYNADTNYAILAAMVTMFGDEDEDIDEDDALAVIELAAGQLEDAGIVSFTKLDAKLIDGGQDYQISLTEKGREFVAIGQVFRHLVADL